MQKYLEITEQVDVTEKTDQEIEEIKIQRIAENPDRKIFIHECFHDETPHQPCTKEEI
ncbi:MAG: hypothetical protein KAJ20_00800 [Candidatus Aenigmarchaeota archaeon]|nr:hypothetical protein [Candidatus Aenigmarchaeota archaeon]